LHAGGWLWRWTEGAGGENSSDSIGQRVELERRNAEEALRDDLQPRSSPSAQADNVGAVMLGEIQAMQRACKEDEELAVLYRSGEETIRVLEFIVPAWPVLVLSGVDEAKNTTRIVTTAECVQLICKVMKVQPAAKPVRLGFRVPKPKPE
jgi:hypothetical protein